MILLQFLIMPPAPDERPDDLVGASYVARRFGCSVRSVYAGKCGTGGIVPVSRDPWRALRSEVEEARRAFVEAGVKKSPKARAMRLLRRKTA